MHRIFGKKSPPENSKKIKNPFEQFNGSLSYEQNCPMVFITGVGRSGTHFLAELFSLHPSFFAFHLDEIGNATADSFWMYAKWYELPIELDTFHKSRAFLCEKATQQEKVFLESNPYLALSISDLASYFPKAYFIITIRDPRKVVLSHLNKGWYKNYAPSFHPSTYQAPGYEYAIFQPNHFFGRIIPKSKETLDSWMKLTQVGKIAWMWQTLNNSIHNQLKMLPDSRFSVIDMDNFEYYDYINLMQKLSITSEIDKETFTSLVAKKPGKTSHKKYNGWGEKEENEFVQLIQETQLFS